MSNPSLQMYRSSGLNQNTCHWPLIGNGLCHRVFYTLKLIECKYASIACPEAYKCHTLGQEGQNRHTQTRSLFTTIINSTQLFTAL